MTASERSEGRKRPDRLKLLNLPRAVAVEMNEHKQPTAILMSPAATDGTYSEVESSIRHVVEIGEIWRVDDEWWRTPIARQYVEIVLEEGGHAVLYNDLINGEWFLQTI